MWPQKQEPQTVYPRISSAAGIGLRVASRWHIETFGDGGCYSRGRERYRVAGREGLRYAQSLAGRLTPGLLICAGLAFGHPHIPDNIREGIQEDIRPGLEYWESIFRDAIPMTPTLRISPMRS
jgi:hypothetical protein